METEYKNSYMILYWNKNYQYKGCIPDVETKGDAEKLFSEYFNQYDNVQLVEVVNTVIKHKKYI